MIASVTDLNSIPAGLWTLAGLVVGMLTAAVGGATKIILSIEADKKDLRDKVINEVLPNQAAMIEATKNVINLAQELTTALAVAQAVKDERQPPHRRQP